MQSGRAQTAEWLLEYEPAKAQVADPLMGWIGGGDTTAQVRLRFETRDAAIAFAERHAIPYDLEQPHSRLIRPKAYADNFRYGRAENWTH
jgi:hypothetical protein